MAGEEKSNLTNFLKSGIYKFPNSNTTFIDPVRILNNNYSQFRVSPSSYYSRFFNSNSSINKPQQQHEQEQEQIGEDSNSGFLKKNTKRKRNQKKNNKNKNKKQCVGLNEKELLADQRHQEIRPILVKAHEELLLAKEVLDVICELNCEPEGWQRCIDLNSEEVKEELSLVELGKVWQAQFYEIALRFNEASKEIEEDGDSTTDRHYDPRLLPLFNNLNSNETDNDAVAEFLTLEYVLPKRSCFYMSDLGRIHNLVPADADCGFNFIVVDPPWENRSVYQKSAYSTLPNRYFLSIPIRKFAHTNGALVALWVTNREKLRNFVENELFPAWGVTYAATLYWLKVKADGSLICDLDLFHHRPYECLLIGYTGKQDSNSEILLKKALKDDQVMISVPGDYSRKPPVGDLLLEYVPGPRPARCIELFAREMSAGWTSWGNEPLHFQEARYFSQQTKHID
ncbi:methyltransferase-like protein 2 [Silene latifolia]|uniref:methyltransferase-like protein 2 n=1 Tax=Silene latifolia TaxID=37657 RepID=UPI003D76D85C